MQLQGRVHIIQMHRINQGNFAKVGAFRVQGFHHPGGSQEAYLKGLAHVYNLVP